MSPGATLARSHHELLCGRDHIRVGESETRGTQECAIAISAGGAAKVYAHTEPNEDATFFMRGSGGTVVAVADGHHGAAGSQTALESLAQQTHWTATETDLTSADAWEAELLAALVEANNAMISRAKRLDAPASPTTVSLAVLRPREDLLLHASIGDSHLFVVQGAAVTDVGLRAQRVQPKLSFLGRKVENAKKLAARTQIGYQRLSHASAVVLATDGLSESGIGVSDPNAAVRDAVVNGSQGEFDARRIAENVVAAALEAHRRQHSGDNIAVATAAVPSAHV